MKRRPEPELMDDPDQAMAYAEADFEQPHTMFVDECLGFFGCAGVEPREIMDLGCGPCDIVARLARRLAFDRFDAIDGAEAMIALARRRLEAEGLADRVRLIRGYIPNDLPEQASYDAIVSNSILHHLNDPMDLWRAVKRLTRPGAAVFVMDLRRPPSEDAAKAMVDEYAGGEPDVLRHDFYCSLLAAYRPDEVAEQISAAGLSGLSVSVPTDRHLIVSGRISATDVHKAALI
ncbi:MAG: methyltransferase domain-containing protein [Gammaproteobacteria bacterium]|nr:methyltransferase domain-containing protein [Gammaproteobacteria bacterium]